MLRRLLAGVVVDEQEIQLGAMDSYAPVYYKFSAEICRVKLNYVP